MITKREAEILNTLEDLQASPPEKRKKRITQIGMEIGERIAKTRKRRGVKQAQLGPMVGLSRAAAHQWEIGRLTRIDVLYEICEALQCSFAYIVAGVGDSSKVASPDELTGKLAKQASTTDADVLNRLRALITYSRREEDLAEQFGVSLEDMQKVLSGEAPMSDAMIAAAGMKKIVIYTDADR